MRRLNAAVAAATLIALSATSALSGPRTGQHPRSAPDHEHLRVSNSFQTPEEVIRYYCGRDASGFVWAGLLDAERAAFTLWQEAPQQDSFFIAKSYDVVPLEHAKDSDRAEVEVRYQLSGIGDAHGTRMPAVAGFRKVTFSLRKVDGRWKIERPSPEQMAPTVLETKFPGI